MKLLSILLNNIPDAERTISEAHLQGIFKSMLQYGAHAGRLRLKKYKHRNDTKKVSATKLRQK